MTAFEYHPRTRLIFGAGCLDRLGELARELGARKVLLVTDPGLTAAGHPARARELLEAAGLSVQIFDEVHENPTTLDVEACRDFALQSEPDLFVGLGGGSSIDAARGCNLLLTGGGRLQDYRGHGKQLPRPPRPLIAIPTTAGTGSEGQSFALIADPETHQKMACGTAEMAARVALLDPALTLTQPREVTINTGLDALAHAVETAVTSRRSPISLLYSRKAFALIEKNFPRVLEQPDDIEARGEMLLAAAFGGIAIENSMLGAAHAASNPLTAGYGVVHGRAVAMMLPHVVRFNMQSPEALSGYKQLDDDLLARIEALLGAAGIPRTLGEYGIPESAIPELAKQAQEQWTGRFNPRPLTASEFEGLYSAASAERV